MKTDFTKYYAIVPAAGSSSRMGCSKLLLPWPAPDSPRVDESPWLVIDSVLQAWTRSQVQATVVVVRREDQALHAACLRWPVHVVSPAVDPTDMKASIQHAVHFIQSRFEPSVCDGWFVAPADLPTLSTPLVERLIQAAAHVGSRAELKPAVVPVFGDKPGHPVLLPWSLTTEIPKLATGQGLDILLAQHPQIAVPLPAELAPTDVDTPAEYQAALDRASQSRKMG